MTDQLTHNTPLDMFYHWESQKPNSIYLRQPVSGQWSSYSWQDVGDQARRIATALQAIEFARGNRICILADNCAHWVIADLAIMMSGASSAPAFTSMSADDVLYILEHSNSKMLFVGQTGNWQELSTKLPKDITVISLPNTDAANADYTWNSLLKQHEPLAGNVQRDPQDEVTTIYTSGSTGNPKGVMYSFQGAAYVAHNLGETFRMSSEDRMISYLPMAHGFERAIITWMSMNAGYSVGFNENLGTFSADINEVKPTVFQCVPRLWCKFQEKVLSAYGGHEKLNTLLTDSNSKDDTINTVKCTLGLDQCRLFFTGSAPTPIALHEWYESLQMPLCELYGQSEILSGTTNLPWDRKPGTLGKPTCNTELKITEQGEILIKAKSSMSGYLNEPEKTAETLIDGWIHTGDKGRIDGDGFLIITGRVKEIFKTAKGKYVAPAPIEGQFVSNPNLDIVCLVGSSLPCTVLIAQLSEEGKTLNHGALGDDLSTRVHSVNAGLGKHEKIAFIIISNQDWSSNNGFITHTMKIKRAAIEKHYLPLAEAAFKDNATTKEVGVIWEK